MQVGDLVKYNDRSVEIGIVLEIKPHPYLPQNGNLCKVQWPNCTTEVMCSWLEVISESR